MPERTLWWADPSAMNTSEEPTTPMRPADEGEANLVSSLLDNGLHSPVLDIDFPARLVPSSTPGHFHLYLDGLQIEWEVYEALIHALAEAKVIGKGYAHHAIERRQTVVRRPGVLKERPVPVPAAPAYVEEPF